jgi:mycofactocin precursor
MEQEQAVLSGSTDALDAQADAAEQTELVEHAELVDELLIEEISIDGMCGVY